MFIILSGIAFIGLVVGLLFLSEKRLLQRRSSNHRCRIHKTANGETIYFLLGPPHE